MNKKTSVKLSPYLVLGVMESLDPNWLSFSKVHKNTYETGNKINVPSTDESEVMCRVGINNSTLGMSTMGFLSPETESSPMPPLGIF